MALFTSLALCGLIAIPLIFIIQLIILPLKRLNSFKKEGVMTYFFPIIGFWKYLLDSMKNNVTEFAEKAAKNKVLVTNFGDKVLIMFQSAQYNREFLANQNLYVKGKPTLYMKKMMGDGLVYAEGENWKRHRKIISACFHFDFLKANTGLIQKTAQEIFKQITPQEYKDFKVVSKVEQITGEIVGKIFLGENLNSYTFEGKPLTLGLAEILCELQKAGETPLVVLLGEKALDIPFIPRYAKVMKKVKGFRKVCLDLISARKALPVQKEDLLGLLLATQKSEDVEKRLTDEDIIDEFITFFLAGMDTTAHLVGMMLYCLIQNPEYLLQIKQEVSTLYSSETDISVDTLQKMKMLHAVMRETLRLYTPAPLMAPREALKDHKILDVEVKKGDFVTAHFMIPGFDEASFEKPQEFNPMRWVNPDKKIDPYAAIPFSGGARNCIGQHLAIIEAKIIVSEFLKMFDYKLKDGYQIRFGLKPIFGPLDDLLVDLNANHTL